MATSVLKMDFMTKRSIMKSRIRTENYKGRWFVLTALELTYHDGNADEQPGKQKGRIFLKNIKVVEKVEPEEFGGKPNVFQVLYTNEAGEAFNLYIMALSPESQEEWIFKLRQTSQKCGAIFYKQYHPGIYSYKLGKWLCCERIQHKSEGCCNVTSISEKLKPSAQDKKKNDIRESPIQGRPDNMPVPKPPEKPKKSDKVKVLAVFSYDSNLDGDLSLEKGEEYEILEKNEEHWWKAKNSKGEIGFIPVNYVKIKEGEEDLEEYDWYYPNTSRVKSEEILNKEKKEGCFLVRESSTSGMYTLSIYATERDVGIVKHYHIKRKGNGDYYLTEKHAHRTVPMLIHYHKHNCAGLIVRLRSSPAAGRNDISPAIPGLGHDRYEIDRSELQMLQELGAGVFGTVKLALYRNTQKVAVKMMKEGTMSEDDFIDEAKTMKELQHNNLVRLFGVSTKERPLYIITEYMSQGSLLTYLKRHKRRLLDKSTKLIDMCHQVSQGMAYLESKSFIHRDLAARNCLVGENDVCKVGDFGLARFVLDDEYTSSHGTKFPIRWAPPEVLSYTRFSSKSDVWSYGVLMWEVFSGGSMPYGQMRNQDIVTEVCQQNKRLERPQKCPEPVYDLMQECWNRKPEERPDFSSIVKKVKNILHATADYL
ncbi:hypothetical protein LSH36_1035g01017 [Paralvinella palmiformis]|uniref:Tyrosine-protein kinase n=1 Tax=Paralvinella palmiformis TaxID=53620 RepID=A0AAD9IVU6_9ANNE|nr:hypothetical protein LSH36_1035g01017 [Paralvinella palmiformis]